MKRAIFAFLGATVIGMTSLFAAEGGLEVVKAEYGANDTWSDVTKTVRKSVAGDSLELKATNATLGDPLGGVEKELKVLVKYKGVELSFNTKENETLSLDKKTLDKAATASLEAAKSGLVILKAEYGANDKWLDVTGKVKELVASGSRSIKAGNESFGDPAGGVVKGLKIKYRQAGQEFERSASEGDSIQLGR